MFGLAQMCWLAAIYRSSQLTWQRAIDFTEVSQPEPRTFVDRSGQRACPISWDYYRIIDNVEAALKAGRDLVGITITITVPRFR